MYNDTYFLLSVVVLAFIAGFAIVSVVMNKMKSKKDQSQPPNDHFIEKGPGV